MNPGIIFASIAAIAFGFWTFFHQQAADKINYLLGAIIVSLTAVVLGLIILLPKIKTINFSQIQQEGIIFAIAAGVCALAIDYFALRAYDSGLAISVAGPIIISGSITVAVLIGLFLGESITTIKILGLILVIIGSGILASIGK